MTYKAGDLVLIHFKRGAKLAQIMEHYGDSQYVLKIWKAGPQKWSLLTYRSQGDIIGIANASEQKLWRYCA